MKELMNYLMNDVLCKARLVYQIAVDNGLENTQDYLDYQDELNELSISYENNHTEDKLLPK